ncbi:MAG: 5-guanidino-2-oxopentanoate decarboxylase [Rhodobacterales bacterium]|nr:5-guanidino-2-oxopentanoate decarboxylase [Rhodobacterales bacterium]
MLTLGQALVAGLEARGVDVVFGIPGVHTIELYRGLSGSGIRHVTPRHEMGAGFMADGYARATGRPGVAFVITGPGLTNVLTPMAQARADSIPMLVVSSVNPVATFGLGHGYLHELPDQQAMAATVAVRSIRVASADEVGPALDSAWAVFTGGRPGPVHIEVPRDLLSTAGAALAAPVFTEPPVFDPAALAGAAERLGQAGRVVIIAGGGAVQAGAVLGQLAERLDAPVVLTVNGRGLMHGRGLCVPASPSLQAVRALLAKADCVFAVGTEIGQTDFDMYATVSMPVMPGLIRVDISGDAVAARDCALGIVGDARAVCEALLGALPLRTGDGVARARVARTAALEEIGPVMRAQLAVVEAMQDACPGALIVGDSTQPVYAGNLYYDHDRAGGWFNAATGYGALGYGIPAAIGAAIGQPDVPVICLTGDGGAQFSLGELMVAAQMRLPVSFVIWNNHGYQEIADSMVAAQTEVIGCDPSPPDFAALAQAVGMSFTRVSEDPWAVRSALAGQTAGPRIIEIAVA